RYATTLVPESLAAGQTVRDTLRLDIGTAVSAQFLRELGDTTRVLRGGIGVLDTLPTPAAGVAVNINVPSVNADAWEAIGNRVFASPGGSAPTGAPSEDDGGSGYAPPAVAIKARELGHGRGRPTR